MVDAMANSLPTTLIAARAVVDAINLATGVTALRIKTDDVLEMRRVAVMTRRSVVTDTEETSASFPMLRGGIVVEVVDVMGPSLPMVLPGTARAVVELIDTSLPADLTAATAVCEAIAGTCLVMNLIEENDEIDPMEIFLPELLEDEKEVVEEMLRLSGLLVPGE